MGVWVYMGVWVHVCLCMCVCVCLCMCVCVRVRVCSEILSGVWASDELQAHLPTVPRWPVITHSSVEINRERYTERDTERGEREE